MKARQVQSIFRDTARSGDYCFRRTRLKRIVEGIMFRCPCGRPDCDRIVSLDFDNYYPEPEYPLRDLTPEEHARFDQYHYVKYEEYPPSDSAVTGRFWTQTQLAKSEKRRPVWHWDGNEQEPTLSPSIQALDGCHWHGFLRVGHWVTA